MRSYKYKWCPKNGCGKKCKRIDYSPQLGKPAKYQCLKCGCKFSTEEMLKLNNIRIKIKD
jgi:hypothetical protein